MRFQPAAWSSAFFVLLLFGVPTMATEESVFTSSLKEGAFEVRSYPALVAAQVNVTGTRDEASTAGFKLLAGYIFGGNTRRQSIAMTAPVVQAKAGSETCLLSPSMQVAIAQVAKIHQPDACNGVCQLGIGGANELGNGRHRQ